MWVQDLSIGDELRCVLATGRSVAAWAWCSGGTARRQPSCAAISIPRKRQIIGFVFIRLYPLNLLRSPSICRTGGRPVHLSGLFWPTAPLFAVGMLMAQLSRHRRTFRGLRVRRANRGRTRLERDRNTDVLRCQRRRARHEMYHSQDLNG